MRYTKMSEMTNMFNNQLIFESVLVHITDKWTWNRYQNIHISMKLNKQYSIIIPKTFFFRGEWKSVTGKSNLNIPRESMHEILFSDLNQTHCNLQIRIRLTFVFGWEIVPRSLT